MITQQNLNYLDYKVSLSVPPKRLEYLLQTQDGKTNILPKRSIALIKAPPKQGKTQLAKILMSCVLNGDNPLFFSNQPDFSVLYVDTEQDAYHSYLLGVQVCGMAQLPVDSERFEIFNLSEVSRESRLNIFEALLLHHSPSLVVLDGVVDLCRNFNDQAESQSLVDRLNQLAKRYDCCILSVIHTNKGDDNSRGHLGAFYEQKATDVFAVKKTDQSTFSVTEPVSRHLGVDEFLFYISSVGTPDIIDNVDYRKMFTKYLAGGKQMTNKELVECVMIGEQKCKRTVDRYISDAVKFNVLGGGGGKGKPYFLTRQ